MTVLVEQTSLSSREWYQSSASRSASQRSAHVSPVRPARPEPHVSPAPWLPSVAVRINALQSLDKGWDGYGSDPLAAGFARAVVRFLADPVWCATPRPQVTPTSDGGLSATWQNGGITLELEFSPLGIVDVYVSDQAEDTEWEGDIRSLPDGLEKWAWRVAVG